MEAAKHKAAGHGFGYGLAGPDSVPCTLSARYCKDGSEILVSQSPQKRPRRLTPRECARLMGFPDRLAIPVSDTQAYKLLAAAVVSMLSAVAKCMVPMFLAKESTVADAISVSPKAFPSKGNWTSEQLKLAFHFYCQTPFGKLHSRNPRRIQL